MLFKRLYWKRKFKTVKVFSLVGKSGSGKSYQAGLVMQKYSIDLLIDDGLIIRNQKIICGKTAKDAENIFDAVGTAIFSDEIHRHEAQRVLSEEKFKKMLIIGTSDKMIRKICHALLVPLPHTRIDIKDITSEEERQKALQTREQQQSHVVPVPVMEVQKMFPSMLARSISIIIRNSIGFFKQDKIIKKSIVRPAYSESGNIKIAKDGIMDIINICIQDHAPKIKLVKISIKEGEETSIIDMHITVERSFSNLGEILPKLQQHIISNIQNFTGIIIRKLNVIIDNVV